MKKILGVVLASALVAGAFAQVKTGVEFDTNLTVADWATVKDGDNTSSYLEQKHNDDTKIGVTASDDNAGVTAEIKFNLNNVGVAGKDPVGVGTVYGWFTVKGFKVSAGKFNSRWSPRLKNAADDAINLSILEPYKYGSAIKEFQDASTPPNKYKNPGFDIDNMTNGAKLAMIGDYTFAIGESKLLVKGSIFDSDPKFSHLKSGYAFEAGFQTKLFWIDAVVKVPYKDTVAAGAFFYMKPLDMLTFVVGGTFAFDNRIANTDISIIAFDARARVKPLDALAITVMGNYSLATAKPSSGDKSYVDGKYAAVNAEYMLNDMFTIFGEVGYFDTEAAVTAGDSYANMKVQAGTIIKPVEKVSVAAALQLRLNVEDKVGTGAEQVGFGIPVALQIAF
ncbi:hypothetical protein [Treponema sp. Marseille-Q4130]|uniref:hypothetical protein n=1 Tax=Treponema sp. Marseille-Q4130 TaxID=2766702 RepID=UPI001651B833|nr:hypothetical protein [Treponema sp. Marseille-Q4130]MBC6720943.1 hypothetical protein [Treponema sp. Marseille-Q4130]